MDDVLSRDWPAPAKLNLFLHVTGRRADGYHDLQTLFQILDHGDRLHFGLRDDGRIDCHGAVTADPREDLAWRAARLLQVATGTSLGAVIHLDKRLPTGGGLGGGSSDAATVLLALNRLWGCDLPVDRLAGLGLRLGADVPLFVRGRSAWAEGVGERLQPVDLPGRVYLVLTPRCQVGTATVFQAPELTRDSPPITMRGFLAGMARNDCLPVVLDRYPVVAEAYRALAETAEPRMSGTGASLFAAFDDEAQARAAWPPGIEGFIARGVSISPVLDRLEREGG